MKSFTRRPIGNFFIKKDLQIRLMTKIVSTVLITTVVCVATLLLGFRLKYGSILIYKMALDGELTRDNIVMMLLPSLIISALVNILLGIGVGMYASRKYAVPIYKLEQWAMLLKNGHLTAKLRFREKEEMKELSDHCNLLAEDIRGRFARIREHLIQEAKAHGESEDIAAAAKALEDLELQASVDVTTGFYSIDKPGETSAEKPAT